MNTKVWKSARLVLVLILLAQLIGQPAASAFAQPPEARPTVAYLHGQGHSMLDELNYLASRGDRTYSFLEFTGAAAGGLWEVLGGLHVLVIEVDLSADDQLLSELSSRAEDIRRFIRSGGRVYVSLSASGAARQPGWLPFPLETGITAPAPLTLNDIGAARLFSKPNPITAEYFARSGLTGTDPWITVRGEGYTPLIETGSGQPVLVYQTLGSGILIVSGAGLEDGFAPEWVDNVIDPLPIIVIVVGKVLITAIAEHLVTEYVIKPAARPVITGVGKKYNITQIDEDKEADAVVDIAMLAVSIKNIVKEGSKGIAQYALARKATGQAVGGHMRWAYEWGAKAMFELDKELADEVIVDPAMESLTQSQKDELTSKLSPPVKTDFDINDSNSYPYYLENTLPDQAYTGIVDPVLGLQQQFDVAAGTQSVKVYVAWDYMFCGAPIQLINPMGYDQTPVPVYPGLNAIELSVNTPASGRWTLKIKPVGQLNGKEVGIVVNAVKPRARVLFDASHDEWFSADGSWSWFADELRRKDFAVDVLRSSPITLAKLAPYDVFVFGGWAHTPLTSSEISAIRQYVQNGGGLLLAYDEVTSSVYNSISSYYGVDFIDQAGLDDPTDDEYGSYAPVLHVFSTHPIFKNVSAVQFYWVHYLSRVVSPSAGILFTDGDTRDWNYQLVPYKPMIAVTSTGLGRIVSVSDANLWNNWDWDGDGSADIYDRDNLRFGVNIISWLADVPAPAVALGNLDEPQAKNGAAQPARNGSLSGMPAELPPLPAAEPAAEQVTAREHEQAVLDGMGGVTRVEDTIAVYGNGWVDVTDAVPTEASLTFTQQPTYDVISGGLRWLTWQVYVEGYGQIAYTIQNTSTVVEELADVQISLLANQVQTGQQSTVFLNVRSSALQDLEMLKVEFDVPKSTPAADLYIGETETAYVSDEGSHYHITVPFMNMSKGSQVTALVPVVAAGKQLGSLTLVDNAGAQASQADLWFIHQAGASWGGGQLNSRGAGWALPDLTLQVVSSAGAAPALLASSQSYIKTLSPGEQAVDSIYLENIGSAAAWLSSSLSYPAVKPAGVGDLPAAWVGLPSQTAVPAGASADIPLTFTIPLDAQPGEYMATLNLQAGLQTLQFPVLVSVIPLGLIKQLHVQPSQTEIVGSPHDIQVCVTDDQGLGVSGARLDFYGAKVDQAPVYTDLSGCAGSQLYPREEGIIVIAASKDGYVGGESEITVSWMRFFVPMTAR